MTSAWLLIGVVVLLVQRVVNSCAGFTGIRSWPWGLFYGLGTLGLVACSLIYFDELPPAAIARARSICIAGALLAALLSLIAFGVWSDSGCGP